MIEKLNDKELVEIIKEILNSERAFNLLDEISVNVEEDTIDTEK